MAAALPPETPALRCARIMLPPVPKLWWVAGAVYWLLMLWLALRSRVYIDQVWIVEYGRLLLGAGTDWSMFMRPDGTTPLSTSWLGPLVAELSFRLGGLLPFRLLVALSAVISALCVARLSQLHGAPVGVAALAAGALLLDPSMVQSVQVGRADSVALALLFGGMLLAAGAAEEMRAGGRGWRRLAVGYGLCALAPAAWSSALLLGPLVALHWTVAWRCLSKEAPAGHTPGRAVTAFLLVPAAVFIVAVVLPAVPSLAAVDAARDPWLVLGPYRDLEYFLGFLSAELSVSAALVIAGTAALIKLRPRWLALFILTGIAMILLSGFYQFRVPYLMTCFAVAAALYSAQVNEIGRAKWTMLMVLAFAVAASLFVLRLGFSLVNQALPEQTPWLVKLPHDAKIADYSWDFYESARRDGRPLLRSMPLIDDSDVVNWLRRLRPDFIVSAIDPESTWILVFHPDAVFAASGYCLLGQFDWSGNRVVSAVQRRPPTPLLWKLGLYRDYGPYHIHVPCEVAGREIKAELRPHREGG